jgi:acyl carrier protein
MSIATIEALVLDTLRELAAEPDAVSPDATLEAIDVDSLDLAEFAQVIDEQVGVQLEGKDLKAITTVRDAIDVIAARAAG